MEHIAMCWKDKQIYEKAKKNALKSYKMLIYIYIYMDG